MSTHYRHTQIGWAILGSMAVVAAFVLTQMPPTAAGIAFAPLLMIAAVVVLFFATLTVEVDEEAIRLRFGVGLVRKRIALAEVRSWREVRNPWYSGWGIRLGSGVTLWNVSGFAAVELVLQDTRRFRIGIDEASALARALETAIDHPSLAISGGAPEPPPARRGPAFLLAAGALILAGSALALAPFYLALRPPKVTVGPRGFEVESVFYGQEYLWSDVTEIRLEPLLPRIEARTNGFAGAGVLRGNFRVEGLGNGKLFVEQGTSPYVVVRLRSGFVILSLETPEKTRALHAELLRSRP